MKNLLFIPCYRCAPQIVRVLATLKPYQTFFTEILVIDNISPDSTAAKAKEFIDQHKLNIKVVVNPANIGLGGSHKLAFQHAIDLNFDHVVILHGDDQGTLGDFEQLLKMSQEKVQDSFWMGARFHPASKLNGYSAFRIFGNLAYNALASILSTRTIFDLGGSGLNLFPVKLLKKHPFRQYANDLTFHVYLLLNAFRLNQRVNFHPISWREDDQISNVKLFQQSIKLLKILKSFFSTSELLKDSDVQFSHSPSEWKNQ